MRHRRDRRWLTETTWTSPTGSAELERFDGINVAARIWERDEAKLPRRVLRPDHPVAQGLGEVALPDVGVALEVGMVRAKPQDAGDSPARSS